MVSNHNYKANKKGKQIIMEVNLTVTKFSWVKAAEEVSKRAGKAYSAQYIREVAKGYRTNNQLQPILEDLKLIKKETENA